MAERVISRRAAGRRLAGVLAAGGAGALQGAVAGVHLATNEYPWGTFYRREKRNFEGSLAEVLREVAAVGLDGYEPLARSAADVERLTPLLKQNKLEMCSLYVNSTLHAAEQAASSIEQVLAIATAARAAGTRIIVTNPSPIRWGGPQDKDDAQLEFQAKALNQLAAALAKQGQTLAYHNHDPELRNAAREFHHMMVATDPKLVRLCLDCHWIYRGAGNSTLALYDVLELYGSRVAELHLRQSHNGVWTETFGAGDIDYPRIARRFAALGVKPHLVLEQAVEAASPATLKAAEAHRIGQEYARQVFR
jgi:inosose dehydratase